MIIEVSAQNFFLPFHKVSSNFKIVAARNKLGLIQNPNDNYDFELGHNIINFRQQVTLTKISNVAVQQFLFLVQLAEKVIPVHVHDLFFCWQSLTHKTDISHQSLIFTQTAVGIVAKAAKNTLTFTQVASANTVRNSENASNILALSSLASAYVPNPNVILNPIPI